MTNDKEEIKLSIFAKEVIRQLYKKTKNVSDISRMASKILSEKEKGRFVSEESTRKFIAEIEQDALNGEREINTDVDKLLKSLGQSLTENEEKAEEKEKGLFDKNSPENHLRYCQVLVDKESERREVI